MVARFGAHLLTGAGYGVMAAAAEGFVAVEDRAGLSIGIVPRDPAGPIDRPNHAADGAPYPNPFVEIAVFTALPPRAADWRSAPSRNHVNVLSSHALVALPGAVGTDNELEIAAAMGSAAGRPRPERRAVLIGPREEFSAPARDAFPHAATLEEAGRKLARILRASGFAIGGAPA
jgi:predicted Rossmann-fold nucleotide-binding protein